MNKIFFDVECFPNYFLIAFKVFESSEIIYFEKTDYNNIDTTKLKRLLYSNLMIGFNSINYDVPMITALCNKGYSTLDLKHFSDRIIQGDERIFSLEREIGPMLQLDHIDLIKITPLAPGLKILAGRLHARCMQELPCDPNKVLNRSEITKVKEYCINDLDNTELVYKKLTPDITLREKMSEDYGVDFRSKSNPQIAEAVLAINIFGTHNTLRKKRAKINHVTYEPPSFVKFKSKPLIDFLESVKGKEFQLDDDGHLVADVTFNSRVKIGASIYQTGMGGLHSVEKNRTLRSSVDLIITDADVTSYYPNIVCALGLYPSGCGVEFTNALRNVMLTRIEAKKNKDSVTADCLKIVCNSSIGKCGSEHSFMYDPSMLLRVTLGGQLFLLQLIESLEAEGITVVSANTDGVTAIYDKSKASVYSRIIKEWESMTGMKMELNDYKLLCSRDVSNYIAVKETGDVKCKGIFAETTTSKNPCNEIVGEALVKKITEGKSIRDTITNCQDIRKFLTVQRAANGAFFEGKKLGKVIRWYHSTTSKTFIYNTKENMLPDSNNCVPYMTITDEFPKDLDREWYVREAEEILYQMDFVKRPGYLFED